MSSTTARRAGRPGLTRQDVADAFDALTQRGITDPSLLQLREYLGRGSNTTIARLRQEIRGEQLLATRTPLTGSLEGTVLTVLTGVMEKLGEEAAESADAHIETMRQEFEATNRQLVASRDKAENDLRDMQLEYKVRDDQLRDAKETNRSLKKMLSDERVRSERERAAQEARHMEALESERSARDAAAETEGQRAALEARLADAQSTIDALISRVGKAIKKG